MIQMTVHPFDLVKYHGEICVVDTVWETPDDEHVPFCALRAVDPLAAGGGMYFVDQSSVELYWEGGEHEHRQAA